MRDEGVRSAFITRDKDLAQLMRDGDVFWDFGAREQFGYHDIERHFGVAPERFADYLALTGDDVDNIPGVPGIGHETAASLMKEFASLDDLYADLGRVAGLAAAGRGDLASSCASTARPPISRGSSPASPATWSSASGAEGLRRRGPD